MTTWFRPLDTRWGTVKPIGHWHLPDPARSGPDVVVSRCAARRLPGLSTGTWSLAQVRFEEASQIAPGLSVPIPGRGIGSICARCLVIVARGDA